MSTVLESGHKVYGIGHHRGGEYPVLMLFCVRAGAYLHFVARAVLARQASAAQQGSRRGR
eukprot:5980007-Pleurochrysis_carterae.AAC.1